MAQAKALVPIYPLPVGLEFLANKLAAAQIDPGLVKVEWPVCINRWNPAGSRQLCQVGLLYRAQESRQMMTEWRPVAEGEKIHCGCGECTARIFQDYHGGLYYSTGDHGTAIDFEFPHNVRLCERVADAPITEAALQAAEFKCTLDDPRDLDSLRRWDKRIGSTYPVRWVTVKESEHLDLYVHVTETWGPEEDDHHVVNVPNCRSMAQLAALVEMLTGAE